MEELRWGVQVGLPVPSWTPPILSGSHPLLGLFPFVGFMRAFARIMCSERDKTAAPWKGAIPKRGLTSCLNPTQKNMSLRTADPKHEVCPTNLYGYVLRPDHWHAFIWTG